MTAVPGAEGASSDNVHWIFKNKVSQMEGFFWRKLLHSGSWQYHCTLQLSVFMQRE